jgi:hypothetical protein
LQSPAWRHAFTKLFGSNYLAGFWEDDLLPLLLWHSVPYPEGAPGTIHCLVENIESQPGEYQAPSWSWASVNQPVDFMPVAPEHDIVIHVAGAKVLYSRDNRFGSFQKGSIHFQGVLIPAAKVSYYGFSQANSIITTHVLKIREVDVDCEPMYDCYAGWVQREGRSYLVPVLKSNNSETRKFIIGIVVEEILDGEKSDISEDQEFKRIGLFSMTAVQWLQCVEFVQGMTRSNGGERHGLEARDPNQTPDRGNEDFWSFDFRTITVS